jgi:hypothetical protein
MTLLPRLSAALLLASSLAAAQPPSLPSGLGGAPSLPSFGPPSTPLNSAPTDSASHASAVSGFAEWRSGLRLNSDPLQQRQSINEGRLSLALDYPFELGTAAVSSRLAGDLLIDSVDQRSTVSLQSGSGPLDLREAWLGFSPLAALDLKVGRQPLTWGSGDLLFINDLFSKDWNSFFSGRDSEYLKAPSDAVKAALFLERINIDLVWLPEFDADRYIDGRRISYYDPASDAAAGRDRAFTALQPDGDEWAVRAYQTVAGIEIAGYGYRGYWKSPTSFDPAAGLPSFGRLQVVGASLRGAVAGGIGNIELGYYDSLDDRAGDDPLHPNNQTRLLIGFEHELANQLTAGWQLYIERTEHYQGYRDGLADQRDAVAKRRTLLTNRLSYESHNQTVSWSLFSFYSPSDEDFYLRPKVSWKVNDQLRLEGGFNLFGGRQANSFFGQFEEASNGYLAARLSF